MKKTILYILGIALMLSACANSGREELYNDRTSTYIGADNEFSEIDSYRPRTMEEREVSDTRWNTARKETRWQEYKGVMVRIEILLGNTDLREMRLRLMPSADGMDVDASYRSILAKVANYEMKQICGRNVDGIVVVYDEPSFEVMRPTSYFDYRIEAEGATMRDYGFRCVYDKK